MAASDAKPFPKKNEAYRVTFPIFDADGDLVSGAADLDSEISKDGGTFADCTNEATEIATSSGIYYLDLTSTEMNADTVAIIVKTSTSGAKTTPLVMYPVEDGDIPVNVRQIEGADPSDTIRDAVVDDATRIDASALNTLSGHDPGATLSSLTAAQVNTEVDTALADIHLDHLLAADYDPASKPGTATALLNELVENDGGVSRFTANALEEAPTGGSAPTVGEIADAVWDEALADHDGAGSTGEALAAAGSAGDPWVTALPGAYGAGTAGNIIGNLNDLSAAEVNAEVVDALGTDTIAEMSSGAPTSTPTIKQALMYLYMWLRNDTVATRGATKERRIKNDAGTVIAKATTTDDGSVFSQGKLGAP